MSDLLMVHNRANSTRNFSPFDGNSEIIPGAIQICGSDGDTLL